MARSFSRKKRNTATRRQKPLILIIAEGQNVTESQYFRHFQEQHADYNIIILIPGHVVSNPCFEVWFLLHFRYSTRAYYTSAEVIRDLRKYIPEYEKNADVALLIADDLEIAMKNAEKLRGHFLGIGAEWPSNECNPRTDVPVIIDAINRYRNR